MADSVSLYLKMAASACQTVPVRPDWRTVAGEEGIIWFLGLNVDEHSQLREPEGEKCFLFSQHFCIVLFLYIKKYFNACLFSHQQISQR